MINRTSKVGTIDVQSIVFSSTFQIGDSTFLLPRSKALAVQREHPFFLAREGGLEEYDMFKQPLPRPKITERIRMKTYQHRPLITVGNVSLWGVSASSVFQVGSNIVIDSEARVKHIRQLRPREDRTEEAGNDTEEE